MDYEVLNQWHDCLNMSSLMGYVETTYDELIEMLGEPTFRGGDKTTVEWAIQFEDGLVATIYDWKTGATPQGRYDWHVGGHDRKVVDRVRDILDL